MPGFERFTRRAPDSIVFFEDDVPCTAGELAGRAEDLAVRMRELPVGRFAVFAARPSSIACCLLAADAVRRELVIARSPAAPEDPYWSAIQVGALVEADSLRIQPAAGVTARMPVETGIVVPTSGTSGQPKHTLHRLEALLGRIRPARNPAPARWLLTYLPHSFAGLQVILTALATGDAAVSVTQANVSSLASAAVSNQVTHISGTPTFWRAFLLCLGESASRLSLQQITMGGELADQATLDRVRAAFPTASVSHIYASTEAGALFSVRDGKAGFPAVWLEEPVDGVSLRIREGVLEVRSPRAMLGYIDRKELPVTADGWLITGDRVEVRDGRVYFLGRQDSVFNVGGAKVTPEEIEAALLDVPGILDLRAFAVPNPITGSVIGLEVAVLAGADEESLRRAITQTARNRLTSYKVPRLIRFVDAIRSDPTGKKSRRPA